MNNFSRSPKGQIPISLLRVQARALYLHRQIQKQQSPSTVDLERQRCADDPVYFVTRYCHAQNLHDEDFDQPLPAIEAIPDWPQVRAMLEALFPARDVVIEKSRRMMASWVMMAAVLHDLLFKSQWPIMVVSRVETDVDNGGENSTSRSLFGKVRFMWDRLPDFLRDPLVFKYLSIKNPKTGAYVEGYSSTVNAGRGGGYRRAILDEFAWMEHSEQVMASVGQACAWGKVLTSTPHGRGNAFYRLRQAAYHAFPKRDEPQRQGQFALYTIHWSLHPHRDATWRQRLIESNAMTEESVAQELEIDYVGSRGRRVYPKYVEDQHMAGGSLCPLSDVDYAPSRPVVIAADWNHDPLIWEIAQTYAQQPTFRVIDELALRNAVVSDVCYEFIYRYAGTATVDRLLRDHPEWHPQFAQARERAGTMGHQGPVWVYGDATEEKSTVHNRVKTYQSVKAMLREYGFDVTLRVPAANPPVAHRIETHNHAIGHGYVVVAARCEQLRRDYEGATWNKAQSDVDQTTLDDDGSGLTRSHASSAVGYWLTAVHKVVSTTAISRATPRTAVSYLPKSVSGW